MFVKQVFFDGQHKYKIHVIKNNMIKLKEH